MTVVARGVGRRWGEREVLAGVDLEVAPGEVVGVVGPNGGGKSTLLLVLAGLVRPTAGAVTVDGVPAADLVGTGAVGLITAEPGLYPLLTGWENLRFFAGLHGATAIDAAAAAVLAELRVEPALMDARVATWSSGTRQKVSLARALLLGPRVLLLDEPTSHLDPVAARQLHQVVRARADAGAAVVVVTHDLHAAEHVCDRVVGLDRRVVGERAGRRAVPPASPLLALFPAAEEAGAPAAEVATALRPGWARVLHVARREWREQGRQPAMLAALAVLYAVVAGLVGFGVLALDRVQGQALGMDLVTRLLAVAPSALAVRALGGFAFLAFTQLLGVVAVGGGHALLHDRQCGTLVFLLLAPLRRVELLTGKVLGVLGWPLLLYAAIDGVATVGLALVPISRAAPELTASSAGFWVAFGLGAPAWAGLLGAVGTMLS
ncbi:MAG: ATP-binding cassette domain-containing protein, partial [Myxococcota bacterium]